MQRLEEKQQQVGIGLDRIYAVNLARLLAGAWEEYLKVMLAEIDNAQNLWEDYKKRKRHLTAFSQKQSALLITKAIQEMIERYLSTNRKLRCDAVIGWKGGGL